jgi:hypothetical protein
MISASVTKPVAGMSARRRILVVSCVTVTVRAKKPP